MSLNTLNTLKEMFRAHGQRSGGVGGSGGGGGDGVGGGVFGCGGRAEQHLDGFEARP